MSNSPEITPEQAQASLAGLMARLAARMPEQLTFEQVESWLRSIQGRHVEWCAATISSLHPPFTGRGILGIPRESHAPELGRVVRFPVLGVDGGETSSFVIASHAVRAAGREYVAGAPRVEMRVSFDQGGCISLFLLSILADPIPRPNPDPTTEK